MTAEVTREEMIAAVRLQYEQAVRNRMSLTRDFPGTSVAAGAASHADRLAAALRELEAPMSAEMWGAVTAAERAGAEKMREAAVEIAEAVQGRAAENAQALMMKPRSLSLEQMRELDNRLAGQRHAAAEIARGIRAIAARDAATDGEGR